MSASPTPTTCASTVGEVINQAADRYPETEALVVGDRRLTYAQLRTEAGQLAAGMLAAGLRPGDCVCLFAPNLPESYIALIAAAKAGLVFSAVNPRLTSPELGQVLTTSQAKAVLFVPEWGGFDYVERLRGLFPALGDGPGMPGEARQERLLVTLRGEVAGTWSYREIIARGAAPEQRRRQATAESGVLPTDPVFLQFTSGTTSAPKAALLAHAPTTRMAFEIGEKFGLTPDDRYFGCPPICHLGGTTFSFLAVMTHAATFVTLPAFEAGRALATMERERCTVDHGIDSHLQLQMTHPEFQPERLPLRLVSVSAVAQTVQNVAAAFGDAIVISQYGSTETGGAPVCSSVTDSEGQRLHTVGRALPGVGVSIVDPDTGADLGPGEIGEIRVGGWSLMSGYLNQPEETDRLFDGIGRLRTGDLGFLDRDAFLYFTGRLKNVLRTGGENVAAEEVESVLAGFPGVSMAAVVGVPDERLGEVGYAFLIGDGRAAIDTGEVQAFCQACLAKFKVPRYFEVCRPEDLPMTGSGKIQRPDLARLARSRSPG